MLGTGTLGTGTLGIVTGGMVGSAGVGGAPAIGGALVGGAGWAGLLGGSGAAGGAVWLPAASPVAGAPGLAVREPPPPGAVVSVLGAAWAVPREGPLPRASPALERRLATGLVSELLGTANARAWAGTPPVDAA